MSAVWTPFTFLVAVLTGWLNDRQARILEFLQEENRVLRRQLGKKRLPLTDDERRRLAAKGVRLGRKRLAELATLVTPDTILRWHRDLIAKKWIYKRKGPGRPPVMRAIEDLVVKLAKENPTWGYRRLQGALANLGHEIAANTVKRILKSHGIEPAPDRKTTWAQFMKSHWSTVAAADFFTTEVWTACGLVTFYLTLVMRLDAAHLPSRGPRGMADRPVLIATASAQVPHLGENEGDSRPEVEGGIRACGDSGIGGEFNRGVRPSMLGRYT
jgi:transposase